MIKIFLTILVLAVSVSEGVSQWRAKDIPADELLGADAKHVYYYDTDDFQIVVSDAEITILAKTGVFDYQGADDHVMVKVGLSDTIGNLNDKLEFFGFVNTKQPDMVILRDYRMKVFNANHPDNFMVTRIRNYLLNGEGSVTFVIPLFQTFNLRIKLPTIKATQIRQ